MTGILWSSLTWSVRSSAEVSVHVLPHFSVLNDRRDRQPELRITASCKSISLSKQQKKEEHLHSKRSPCENRDFQNFCGKMPPKACMWCNSIAGNDELWRRIFDKVETALHTSEVSEVHLEGVRVSFLELVERVAHRSRSDGEDCVPLEPQFS